MSRCPNQNHHMLLSNYTNRRMLAPLLFLATSLACPAAIRYAVPTGGVATGQGTADAPWTLQQALTTSLPGDTIYMRDRGKDGKPALYKGRYVFLTSGTAAARISLKAYPGEAPILDGTGATLRGDGQNLGLLHIANRSNWNIEGLEIQNFATATTNTAIGIAILGSCQNITIDKCKIHHITATLRGANPGNANAIGIYGNSGTVATSNIVVTNCEMHTLATGRSESVTFNGNVDGFTFSNNVLHHCNNIGVDVIGGERIAPANDQARNGVIRNNEIYAVDSRKNSVYHGVGAAGGIYVDGGRDVLIEANRVYNCNFGIEVGCERAGKLSANVIVRSNWVFHCYSHGILLGGAELANGGSSGVEVSNNTIFRNSGAGIALQKHVFNSVIRNNIVWSGGAQLFVQHNSTTGTNNKVDYNCYYNDAISVKKGNSLWSWFGQTRQGFAAWKATGNDAHSAVGDPLFINTKVTAAQIPDLRLRPGSGAINAGDPLTTMPAATTDITGDLRIVAGRVDIGADEYQPAQVAIRLTGPQFAYEFNTVPTSITISRTGDTLLPLAVPVVISGSAVKGTDYVAIPDVATIPAGLSEISFPLKPLRDTLVEGSETVTFTVPAAVSYAVAAPASLVVTIQDVPVDAWRRSYFGANATKPEIAGNAADPDKDGMPNVTEYAIGSNPNVADSQYLPQAFLQGGYLTMTVRRNRYALDATICPEVSSKLAGPWVSGSNYVTVIEDSPNIFRAVDKVKAANAVQRFMRLRICLQ